jgi:hypothetical protein
VSWVMKHRIKLLNFIGHIETFTEMFANAMAAGSMKLDPI